MSDFIEDFYFGNIEQQEISTEQFKEQNQFDWVQRMNSIRHRAAEIVNAELIYV